MAIITLGEASLGDEVFINISSSICDVDDRSNGEIKLVPVIVALINNKIHRTMTMVVSNEANNWFWRLDQKSQIPDLVCIDNIMDYKYGYWLMKTLRVEFFDKILFKDQVCINCKRPAPHAKPNTLCGYLCSSCKFIETLEIL